MGLESSETKARSAPLALYFAPRREVCSRNPSWIFGLGSVFARHDLIDFNTPVKKLRLLV